MNSFKKNRKQLVILTLCATLLMVGSWIAKHFLQAPEVAPYR